ncbi:hypothetical protein TNCV_5064761 [Trichonephila clavipes]|nr:hypothetical protein TNCV_5064761 [Trichonephila clavipes]
MQVSPVPASDEVCPHVFFDLVSMRCVPSCEKCWMQVSPVHASVSRSCFHGRCNSYFRWCGVAVRRCVPAQVSSTSLDHGSKLRGPSPKALV